MMTVERWNFPYETTLSGKWEDIGYYVYVQVIHIFSSPFLI